MVEFRNVEPSGVVDLSSLDSVIRSRCPGVDSGSVAEIAHWTSAHADQKARGLDWLRDCSGSYEGIFLDAVGLAQLKPRGLLPSTAEALLDSPDGHTRLLGSGAIGDAFVPGVASSPASRLGGHKLRSKNVREFY